MRKENIELVRMCAKGYGETQTRNTYSKKKNKHKTQNTKPCTHIVKLVLRKREVVLGTRPQTGARQQYFPLTTRLIKQKEERKISIHETQSEVRMQVAHRAVIELDKTVQFHTQKVPVPVVLRSAGAVPRLRGPTHILQSVQEQNE